MVFLEEGHVWAQWKRLQLIGMWCTATSLTFFGSQCYVKEQLVHLSVQAMDSTDMLL